jgi:pimeloyl-ACP methyl ester carboxylesterase
MKKLATLLLAALVLPALALNTPAQDKQWPESNPKATLPDQQPEKGPGGSDYAHEGIDVHSALEAGERYWMYMPANPTPKTAPVIVFIHGYNALRPDGYEAWLHHLCKRGNIVIYPQYQAHGLDPANNWCPNIATGVLDAFKYLESDKELVQPDKEKFAIAGHSAGGVTTMNLAAEWADLKLPKPRAIMPIQPGRAFNHRNSGQKSSQLIPFSDFNGIPEDCLLLSVYGDSDTTVGAWCARHFFAETGHLKAENRNLIEFVSCDYSGTPAIAGHYTPAAPVDPARQGVDHFDWFGTWKLLDGLTDAAFHGKHREYALGDTDKQKFMGNYSDGRPVAPLKVWKGDQKVDPDAEEYEPVYDRNGRRVAPEKQPEEKKAEPEKKTPSKTPGHKEEEEEEF